MNKKTNKLYPGDIFFIGDKNKDGKKSSFCEKIHAHFVYDVLKDDKYIIVDHLVFRDIKYQQKNIIIGNGMQSLNVFRYKGPNKKIFVKCVRKLISIAFQYRNINDKKFNFPISSIITAPTPKSCFSKLSDYRIKKYNESISKYISKSEDFTFPFRNVNCTELFTMLWIMVIGTNGFKLDKLDPKIIDKIMPINPHRCLYIGLFKLCKKRPLYWEKIILNNVSQKLIK